jgi:ABC-type multidrug transport system permease subunit
LKAVKAIMATYLKNRLRIKTALLAFWAEGAFSSTIIALALSFMVSVKDYHLYYATGVAIFLGMSYGTIIANELGWEKEWELYLLTIPTRRASILLARITAWSLVSLIYAMPPLIALFVFSGLTQAMPAALGLIMALVLSSTIGIIFLTITKIHPLSLTALHAAIMPLVTRFSTATYPRVAAPAYAQPAITLNPLAYIADLVRYLQGFPTYLLVDPGLALTVTVGVLLGMLSIALHLYERRVEGVIAK